MVIQRSPHDKVNPYVMLNKEALKDPSLSWGAKGLWAYLLSLPDDWKISVAHLSKLYPDKGGGIKAIYSLLNELIECGYCERSQGNESKGKFKEIDYHISEFKKSLPHSPQRHAAERHALEGCTTNKEYILNNKQQQLTEENPQEVVVVVDHEKEEIEKIQSKNLKDFLDTYIGPYGATWDLGRLFLLSLIKKYGINYLTDQVNYMCKQQHQSDKDSKNSYKKKKTPAVENPKSFLGMSCDKNWADSEHEKVKND
jgi:hypothetical protein